MAHRKIQLRAKLFGLASAETASFGNTVTRVASIPARRSAAFHGKDCRMGPPRPLSSWLAAASGAAMARSTTIFCVPFSQVPTTRLPPARLLGTIWSAGGAAPLACIRFSRAAFASAQVVGAALAEVDAQKRQTAAQRRPSEVTTFPYRFAEGGTSSLTLGPCRSGRSLAGCSRHSLRPQLEEDQGHARAWGRAAGVRNFGSSGLPSMPCWNPSRVAIFGGDSAMPPWVRARRPAADLAGTSA